MAEDKFEIDKNKNKAADSPDLESKNNEAAHPTQNGGSRTEAVKKDSLVTGGDLDIGFIDPNKPYFIWNPVTRKAEGPYGGKESSEEHTNDSPSPRT
jgi:hypothetical protein